MPLPQSLRPLRHRQFTLLVLGAFVSNVGTWMETVGVGILVTETTGRASWTGLVAAAGFVPAGLLGPVGGALADRVSRRRLLLLTTSVQTALAGVLATLSALGTPAPGIVTLIVLGSGCANAIGFPSYQAVLPDLVPTEDLVGAVALSSAQWNLGRVIGPALAGIAIAVGGYDAAFAANTLSFFAVIAAILALRLPRPAPSDERSILAAIATGIRYVRAEPGLRVVIVYLAITAFLAAPFIALVPAMAIKVLHGGAGATSTLVTAQGLGAVTMAFSLGPLALRFGSRKVLVTMLWCVPAALVAYAAAPGLGIAAVALYFVGLLYLGAFSSFMSIAQLRADPVLRGRTLSVLTGLLGVLYPLGSVLQGALADSLGLRTVTAAAGILMFTALAGLRVIAPRFAAALDEPSVPFDGEAAAELAVP